MKKQIIPTIFAHNKKEFKERFNKILPISKNIQIDFMDGKLVPSKSVKLFQIPNLKKYNKNFEAHLMVSNPQRKVSRLKRKGFNKIIFHYESLKDKEKILKLIKKIHKKEMQSFIAINPETKMEKIFPFIKDSDGILFMGVHPGKENQEFIQSVYKKIKTFKEHFPKKPIQIDGGVNLTTTKKLKTSGADIINTGSFVSNSKNPKENLEKLVKVFV